MFLECASLFWTFLKMGFLSFGGGYAMLSLIILEGQALGITGAQIADLYALDMVVPGPIAINGATYMGYLYRGLPGALAATLGVSAPSFVLAAVLLRLLSRRGENALFSDALTGIKPATVGLIASAALGIASEVLVNSGERMATLFAAPLRTLSIPCVLIFLATAVLNMRAKINPILLIVLSGAVGAVVLG